MRPRQRPLHEPSWTISISCDAVYMNRLIWWWWREHVWLDSKFVWVPRLSWVWARRIVQTVVWPDFAFAVQQYFIVIFLDNVPRNIHYSPAKLSVFYYCFNDLLYKQHFLHRARLNTEDDIHICLSCIPLCLTILCSVKLAQPSHWIEGHIISVHVVTYLTHILWFAIFGFRTRFEE